jgi:hypothetical protein
MQAIEWLFILLKSWMVFLNAGCLGSLDHVNLLETLEANVVLFVHGMPFQRAQLFNLE